MTVISEKYVPMRGVFESTLGCNLRCRHCGSRAGQARPDELTAAECADLFDQLAELGMRWLTISGGEPTTRQDWPAL
ncbi:MAG: radical SAM protein, partial [Deltaproteobacteria bacterium]|nr:radical SAM protein [Deltaproteobacteria bacterium]